MAVRWYYSHRIGDIYARCGDGKVRRANIFGGNCLCVFTQWFKDEKTGRKMEQFISFYNDEGVCKSLMKKYGRLDPVSDITSIRLNTYYKEAMILAKYFAKSKYVVTLFYKEPKKK